MAARELAEINENPFSPQAMALEKTKRFSSAAEREAAAGALASLEHDGYVILEKLLDAATLGAIADEFARLNADVARGTSAFGGYRTQRLYNLVAPTRALDGLLLHPRVLALAEAHLDDQLQLSVTSSITLHPGETAQTFHRDDDYYPLPRPHLPLTVNCMWAIDDFTADNGATLLMPGSHRLADATPPADVTIVPALMPAGSVIVWDGSLFHAGGANRSSAPRLGITITYARAWLRQQENQFLGVPPAVARELPRPLQKLVGYWVVNNFLGYVNEQSPKAFLE